MSKTKLFSSINFFLDRNLFDLFEEIINKELILKSNFKVEYHKKKYVNDLDCVQIIFSKSYSLFVEEQIFNTLKFIKKIEKSFFEIQEKITRDIEVSVAIYAYGGNTPDLNFSKKMWKELATLNLSLDIDMITLEGDFEIE